MSAVFSWAAINLLGVAVAEQTPRNREASTEPTILIDWAMFQSRPLLEVAVRLEPL